MAIYKLVDLFTISSGSTPNTKNSSLWNGDILWYTPIDLRDDLHTNRTISKHFQKILVPRNTILLSSRAPVGYIGISKKNCWHSQGIKGFINNSNKILNKYFYYWLKIHVKVFQGLGTGSTFKEISAKTIKSIKISLPSIKQQQKIIDIIEPLNSMEGVLKKIVIQINNLIVNMPKKNDLLKIRDVAYLIKNKPIKTKQISAKVMQKRLSLINNVEMENTYKSNSFCVPKNTLLINTIRTYLEKFAIAPMDLDANGTLAMLSVKTKYETSILSLLLSNNFWRQANKYSHGTKMPVINKKDILDINFYPTYQDINNIFLILTTINNLQFKIKKIKKQAINLLVK